MATAKKTEAVTVKKVEIESEADFLKRLLLIQHQGKWGTHLDNMINERISLVEKPEVADEVKTTE